MKHNIGSKYGRSFQSFADRKMESDSKQSFPTPRPYKRRILSPIQTNAEPIKSKSVITSSPYKYSFLDPQNITVIKIQTPINTNWKAIANPKPKYRSRNRSKSTKLSSPNQSYRKYQSRQAMQYGTKSSQNTRIYSRSLDGYESMRYPPTHTLQKIKAMRWNSPPPQLQMKIDSHSMKKKLKSRKLPNPTKSVQIEFIYVYPNGIRYFCRDLSPAMTVSEAINPLNLNHFTNVNVMCNKELLNLDTLIAELDSNEKLVVYDDINGEHTSENMCSNERIRLRMNAILYQTITGIPNVIAFFILKLGSLCTDNVSAWNEILPYNHFPEMIQKHKSHTFKEKFHGKVCLIEVLSPYTSQKISIRISMNDNIGNLRRMIRQKHKFKCKHLLLFAVTKHGTFGNNEVDNDCENSMSFINDFTINLQEQMEAKDTLNHYWIHAQLKQKLRERMKKHSAENVRFFQLRNNHTKLYHLPLFCTKIKNSCIAIKTFVYLIPLPSNAYALRKNKTKLKEILEWSVGKQITSELMSENNSNNNNALAECKTNLKTNNLDLIMHFEEIQKANNVSHMFISNTMTVAALVQKIQSLNKEYRNKRFEVYVYDKRLDIVDKYPLSPEFILLHSMKPSQRQLEIVIKTQNMDRININSTEKNGRSLRERFTDLLSKKEKRAKSIDCVERKSNTLDLHHLKKKRSKSIGIENVERRKKQSKIIQSKAKKKKVDRFVRTKRKKKKMGKRSKSAHSARKKKEICFQ